MSENEKRNFIHLIIPPSWRKEISRETTNKCGNCQWLVTAEGKPYYCAIKDLYTIRMLSTNACEEYLEADDGQRKSR